MNQPTKQHVAELFNTHYGYEAEIIVRSPGRINIIGEHTDYNDGFVLPAAIDKAIVVGVKRRDDNQIRLYAEEFAESYSIALDAIHPRESWTDYILGVVDQYQKTGFELGGFDLVLTGNIPIGSGLSSSAAVECACAFALNELFQCGFERMEMVKLSRLAEHTFPGVKCGIMDQFASMYGKKDQLVKLDCRSLEYEYIPAVMKGVELVLFNTNVKHSLATSAYNERRQQCEEGVRLINEKHPEVKSLRDASMDMVEEILKPADEVIYRRCRYIVGENMRLLAVCDHLRSGNLEAVGKEMLATHDGLSKDYEVSCPELDFLVDFVRNDPNVLGARMVGGGFGGCTINLIKEGKVEEIRSALEAAYKEQMKMELTTYIVTAEDGTSVL
jgi:galactokinase